MPDSDDLLIENSLPVLLETALTTKADMIDADYVVMNDDAISGHPDITQKAFEMKEKSGTAMLLEEYSPEHSYVWHTLYRRRFLLDNHISFHPGIRFQDVPFTHECYLKARKCIKTNVLLNIYRMGQESSTSSFDTKRGKEFCIAISKTWELRHWEGHTPETLRKLQDDVFYSFSSTAAQPIRRQSASSSIRRLMLACLTFATTTRSAKRSFTASSLSTDFSKGSTCRQHQQ